MPIRTMAVLTAKIGAGQRTTAVPTRRHSRPLTARFFSKRPTLLPTKITAGPSVSPAKTTTSIPIATGAPMVLNHGSRAKLRQYVAPAMVRPDPSTTGATLRNVV
jgi:hypothetical protein